MHLTHAVVLFFWIHGLRKHRHDDQCHPLDQSRSGLTHRFPKTMRTVTTEKNQSRSGGNDGNEGRELEIHVAGNHRSRVAIITGHRQFPVDVFS